MKEKRYWLRGGVTGFFLSLGVFFSYILLMMFSRIMCKPGGECQPSGEAFRVDFFGSIAYYLTDNHYSIFFAKISIILILIGICLGFVYGKISSKGGSASGLKNRKSSV